MTKARTYPRRGLHGAVVHDIGVRIVRGELGAGRPPPGRGAELSGELTVSRTVLREAIKVLAAKRLVEARPKTGTRVLPRTWHWNLLDPDVLAWQLRASAGRGTSWTRQWSCGSLLEPPGRPGLRGPARDGAADRRARRGSHPGDGGGRCRTAATPTSRRTSASTKRYSRAVTTSCSPISAQLSAPSSGRASRAPATSQSGRSGCIARWPSRSVPASTAAGGDVGRCGS